MHRLICSDLISRGIDIPSIAHVISYDTPIDMRKYVHRSGRTARAGREGTAWTLLEEQEARHFKIMMKDVGHLDRVKKLRINEVKLEPLKRYYEVYLLLTYKYINNSDRMLWKSSKHQNHTQYRTWVCGVSVKFKKISVAFVIRDAHCHG